MKKYLYLLVFTALVSCSKKNKDAPAPADPAVAATPVNQATKIVVAKVTVLSSTELSLSGPNRILESYIYTTLIIGLFQIIACLIHMM